MKKLLFILPLLVSLFAFADGTKFTIKPTTGSSIQYNDCMANGGILDINNVRHLPSPDDTIQFVGGQTYPSVQLHNLSGGTAGHPIVLTRVGTGQVKISGGNANPFKIDGHDIAIKFNLDTTYGLYVGGTDTTATGCASTAITLNSAPNNIYNFEMAGVEIKFASRGMQCNPQTGNAMANWDIHHNHIHWIYSPAQNTAEGGYYGYAFGSTYTTNPRYINFQFHDNILDTLGGDGFQGKWGEFYVYNNTFRYCGFQLLPGQGDGCQFGNQAWGAIYNNTFINCKQHSIFFKGVYKLNIYGNRFQDIHNTGPTNDAIYLNAVSAGTDSVPKVIVNMYDNVLYNVYSEHSLINNAGSTSIEAPFAFRQNCDTLCGWGANGAKFILLSQDTLADCTNTPLPPDTAVVSFTIKVFDNGSKDSIVNRVATPAPIVPSEPTLTGGAGDTRDTLYWTVPQTPASLTGYHVYRDGVLIASPNSSTLTYIDNGRTNGVTYSYIVTAYNSEGEGRQSNTISLTPQATPVGPSAPTGLSATAGDASVSLSWTNGAAGTATPTNSKVYISTNNSTYTLNKTISYSTSTSVTGLTNGTQYWFKVTTVTSVGESSQSSSATATPTAPSSSIAAVYSTGGGVDSPWNSVVTTQLFKVRFPKNYDPTTSKKWPVLIHMEGTGQTGSDINIIDNEGMGVLMKNKTGWADWDSMIVFIPQLWLTGGQQSTDWYNNVDYALNYIKAHYPVDTKRIYASGFSQGGHGVTDLARRLGKLGIAAGIVESSWGTPSSTQYDNMRYTPLIYVTAENDATQGFYSAGGNASYPATGLALTNPLTPYAPIGAEVNILYPIGTNGHTSAAWNDWANNTTIAAPRGFNAPHWLLKHSLDSAYTAEQYVIDLEHYAANNLYDSLMLDLQTTQRLIDAIASGSKKTELQGRLDAVTSTLAGQGKRYIVALGASGSNANYNYFTSASAGSSLSNLKASDGTSSTKGVTVVTAFTSSTTKSFTGRSGFFSYPYFGFDGTTFENGFYVKGTGGTLRFTGLTSGKTYRFLLFTCQNLTSSTKLNEITVIAPTAGTTAKWVKATFATHKWIEFSGLTPDGSGNLDIQIKGAPTITTYSSTATGARSGLVSNITGYDSGGQKDTPFQVVMLIESP